MPANPEELYLIQQNIHKTAVKGLVWNIFWLGGIGSVMGIYFGIQALQMIRKAQNHSQRRGKAILSVVTGVLGLLLWIPAWWIFLS